MPLNIDFQQIFLHLLNFTILFGGLYFLLYTPVRDFMAKRSAYYEDVDRQAKERLAEADRSRANYKHKLEEADAEIKQKNMQARQEAQDAAQAQLEQVQGFLTKARAEARTEREHMISEAQEDISKLVTIAVEKLVLDTTASVYDQFLEAVGEEDADG